MDEIGLLDQRDAVSGCLGSGGTNAGGLPVGMLIVGRHGNDRGVLEMAYRVEQAS